MKTTVDNQQYDQDERYKRLQITIQQEREESRKQLYDRSIEIEKLKANITSQESEIRRLRREIEDLLKQIREQSQSSHSSSIVFKPKQPLVEHQIPLHHEQHSK